MARLQDFQAVTPSDSDNLLVVQATGQGLATVGSTLGAKMDKSNPSGTGALSLNRSGTTGTNSVALGQECTSTGLTSSAMGYQTKASGDFAFSEGYKTEAKGSASHAFGSGTIANHSGQFVFGQYNNEDTNSNPVSLRGDYIEIVGKGIDENTRSNARTLDWSGNEVLAGGLKINSTEKVSAIKKATATGTTDANGVLWTNISVSSKWVLNAYMDIGSNIDRFVQIGVKNGLYGFRCSNSTITATVSSAGVTVYYYYIDAVS